eukprot:GHVS01029930.1.p1 GENE.GHVS01029930.1~~GHVS01029930.1.p1  ORF type:complete len:216 (-),score=37.30 GHVS01029930.1:852-1499(-)
MEHKQATEIDGLGRGLTRRYQNSATTWQLPTFKEKVTVMQPHQQSTIRCYKQTTEIEHVLSGNGGARTRQRVCRRTEEVEHFHPYGRLPSAVDANTYKQLQCGVSNADTSNGWNGRLLCLAFSFYVTLCAVGESLWGSVKYMWDRPRYAVVVLLCALVVLLVCFGVLLFKHQQSTRPPGLGEMLAAKLQLVASGQSRKYWAKTANKVLQVLLTEI